MNYFQSLLWVGAVVGAGVYMPAYAQSSTTVDITAQVISSNQEELVIEGSAGDFGTLIIPKNNGNVCVYKIDSEGKATVEGQGGDANPEPENCRFDDGPLAAIIKITGEPNTEISVRVTIQPSPDAKSARLELTFPDGSEEFVYPHFQDDRGVTEFSPDLALSIPNTAEEFDGGSIATLTADVTY